MSGGNVERGIGGRLRGGGHGDREVLKMTTDGKSSSLLAKVMIGKKGAPLLPLGEGWEEG
jgi:hypothetical protein